MSLKAFCTRCMSANSHPYYCICIKDGPSNFKPFTTTSNLSLAMKWLDKLALHGSSAVLHRWDQRHLHYS